MPHHYHRPKTFFHHAASASFWAVLGSIFLSICFATMGDSLIMAGGEFMAFIISLLIVGLCIFAMLAGVVSLFGIPDHGFRGIFFKALIGILLPATFFTLAYVGIFAMSAESKGLQQARDAAEAFVIAHAAEMNTSVPVQFDANTRLEKVEPRPDRTLIYHYTLPNSRAADFDLAYKSAVRANLLRTYQESPEMQAFRDHEVTIIYSYKDPEGNLLGEIPIGPSSATYTGSSSKPTSNISADADQDLATHVTRLNRKTPIVIDTDIRLDRIDILPGAVVVYRYTVFSTATPDSLTAKFRPRHLREYDSSPEFAPYRDKGVKVIHRYATLSGNPIHDITVSPQAMR